MDTQKPEKATTREESEFIDGPAANTTMQQQGERTPQWKGTMVLLTHGLIHPLKMPEFVTKAALSGLTMHR